MAHTSLPRGFEFGERAQWNPSRFGLLVHWMNNIPFGTDVYVDNRANAPFSVSGFAPSGVDVNDWVDFGAGIGVDYMVLTVKHNMGWRLYPFTTDMASHTGKDSYNVTISLPQVATYGVNNPAIVGTADQDIVHQFVSRCEFQGVKPVLYYNIGKDINARGGFSSVEESAFSSDTDISDTYGLYTTMVEAQITELLTAFPNVWLWLDAVAWYPRTALISLYSKIRDVGNENTLVIYNYEAVQGSLNTNIVTRPNGTHANYPGTLDGTQQYLWPCDIASYEYSRVPPGLNTAGQLAELTRIQRHKKHVYWRGAEVSTPVFTAGQWSYYDPGVVGGTPNVLESLANLEARADLANDEIAPVLVAMPPDLTGVVSSAIKTRLTDLANHIFP